MRGTGARAILLAGALAVTASACTRVGVERLAANELVVAQTEEPESLDPLIANMAAANDAFDLAFQGLTRFDSSGRLVPDLAREVPTLANGGISADGKTITYHLRADARWHDGVPVRSSDVRFTWRALMNARNNVPSRAGYEEIAGIDTPDEHTARIRLRRPYAPALSLFTCAKQGAIVPEHILGRLTDVNAAPFNRAPVGSGPYRVLRWRPGEDITFERVAPDSTGRAFRHIRFRFFASDAAALNALRSRAAQVYPGMAPEQKFALAGDPRFRIAEVATQHFEHLAFNLRPGSGPQSDPRVREAIARAIDVTQIYRDVYHSSGGLAPLDQAPDAAARDRSTPYYAYDPARARELLALAGYRNRPLRLTIESTAGVRQREMFETVLQAQLHAVGIELSIKNLPARALFSRDGGPLYDGTFELAYFAYLKPTGDPDDRIYVASGSRPPVGQNIAALTDPQIDRLAEEALAHYDERERNLRYARIQRRLIAALPFYTMNWSPEIVAFDSRIDGIAPSPVGSDFWNAASWRCTTCSQR